MTDDNSKRQLGAFDAVIEDFSNDALCPADLDPGFYFHFELSGVQEEEVEVYGPYASLEEATEAAKEAGGMLADAIRKRLMEAAASMGLQLETLAIAAEDAGGSLLEFSAAASAALKETDNG